MFWLIMTVVLGLIGGIAVLTAFTATDGDNRLIGGIVAAMCGLIWLILTFFTSAHLVGQREVGVVHNFSGEVTGTVQHGTAWTAPWQHVIKENVGIQHED